MRLLPKEYEVHVLLASEQPWLLLVARVSDPSQLSALPAQEKRLREYAALKRMPYAYVEFDESAYKGERETFGAQVLEPLMKAKGQVWVTFDKIDRFSRDSSSEEKTVFNKLRKQARIELHFPSDNLFIHRDSPAADLFRLDIGIALSGYYSSTIRDNVNRVFAQILEDLKEFPGQAPIGYVNYDTGRKKPGSEKTFKDIKRDDSCADLICHAFKLRALGASYEAIAQELAEQGLTSRRTGRPASKHQVEKFLTNPFYAGFMRWRGRLYRHRYEPLIPLWLWRQVQTVDESRSHARTKYVGRKEVLFRDMRCTTCGYSVVTDGPKKGGNYYLKCTEYGGRHGAKWVNQRILARQVSDHILSRLHIPEGRIPEVQNSLLDHYQQEDSYHAKVVKRLEAESKQIDEEIKDMYRSRSRFNLREDLFNELVDEKTVRQATIEEDIARAGERGADYIAPISEVAELSSRASDMFLHPNATTDQKSRLLRLTLSNLTWDGQNIKFELKKAFAEISGGFNESFGRPLALSIEPLRDELLQIADEVSAVLEIARSLSNQDGDSLNPDELREESDRYEQLQIQAWEAANIREWARKTGIRVGRRGRIPRVIRTAYGQAQQIASSSKE